MPNISPSSYFIVYRVEFIQLALEHKPLNLGQGLPDDLVPDYVMDSLRDVVNDRSSGVALHQYTRGFVSILLLRILDSFLHLLDIDLTSSQGHPRLISAIAALYSSLLGIGHTLDPLKEVGKLFSMIS